MRTSCAWLRWLPTTSLSLAAIAAPAAPASAAGPSGDWGSPIAESNDVKAYLDVSTLGRRTGRLNAWVKLESSGPESVPDKDDKPVRYQVEIDLYVFDCEENRVGVVASRYYAYVHGDLKPVASGEFGTVGSISMSYVAPGTIEAGILANVCERVPLDIFLQK